VKDVVSVHRVVLALKYVALHRCMTVITLNNISVCEG